MTLASQCHHNVLDPGLAWPITTGMEIRLPSYSILTSAAYPRSRERGNSLFPPPVSPPRASELMSLLEKESPAIRRKGSSLLYAC